MTARIHLFGKKGEQIASSYLSSLGHRIIATNFSCRFGELDIISIHKEIIVFTEVKSRTSKLFGSPVEAVGAKKLSSMIASAHIFMSKHKNLPEQMRFDVIECLEEKNGRISVNHIQNITL